MVFPNHWNSLIEKVARVSALGWSCHWRVFTSGQLIDWSFDGCSNLLHWRLKSLLTYWCTGSRRKLQTPLNHCTRLGWKFGSWQGTRWRRQQQPATLASFFVAAPRFWSWPRNELKSRVCTMFCSNLTGLFSDSALFLGIWQMQPHTIIYCISLSFITVITV